MSGYVYVYAGSKMCIGTGGGLADEIEASWKEQVRGVEADMAVRNILWHKPGVRLAGPISLHHITAARQLLLPAHSR